MGGRVTRLLINVVLLYKVQCFWGILGIDETVIISHVRLFMIISYVKSIGFQTIVNHSFRIFYIGRKDCMLYNEQKNTWCLEIASRVEHDISHLKLSK